jgi:subtilisin family serine protease
MSERLRARRIRWASLAAATLAATAGLILATTGSAASGASAAGLYIVRLAEQPVVTYDGGIAGLEATKPAKGQKIDPQDQKVAKYVAHLDSRHNAVLESVGGGQKLYDYRYALNGFAAQLSAAQVAALEKDAAVAAIEPVEEWGPDTSDTPAFLGLTGPGNLWDQLGGPSFGTNPGNAGGAGEGIVVGVLDTGIWPEHPSVSDKVGNKVVYGPAKGFHGHCTSAEQAPGGSWDANLCNKKLIGARYFIATFDASGTVLAPNDFRSPRDSDGHGTHTSTTAAGNFGIEPTGAAAGFGAISGMAPRARIATYKVCWDDGNPATGGCFTSDSAAAIDQAVADGVDVINFSIGGTATSFLNAVEVAAFNAAGAGVFVAMSAGNDGPTAGTVGHPSPWLTTVAADTHPRPANGVVTLGDGSVFNGVSQTKVAVGPVPVIRAQDAGLAGEDANLLRQCFSQHDPLGGSAATLDPAKVAGKIVVCERGGTAPNNARVDKSRAVLDAGGVGMILINVAAGASLNGDFHFVPTVHLPSTTLAQIQTYAQTVGPTARIAPGSPAPVAAPFIAAFSSRGPSAATGDQLKPDLAAPGVDVLAGYSPASLLQPGFLFNLVSGTSMSSPHVAGLGALLKHKHPGWTPAMIKSALMTTGENVLGTFAATGTASGDANRAFAQGAGHVRPTAAADPGLVFNNGPVDWFRFICGTGQLAASACTGALSPIDPSDLNLASIAIFDTAGIQTVTRTVTSVGSAGEMYTASASVPGVNVSVDPAVFTIQPGATQALNITFTRTTADLSVYQSGFLTLSGSNGHSVRLPLVIRPVSLAAPLEVSLDSSNAATWSIKSGVGPEDITLGKRGLIPATTDAVTLPDDPDNAFSPTVPEASVFSKDIVVPAGTAVLRGATFDADTDGNDDLDLRLYRVGAGGALTLVASSGGPTSEEVMTLRNPIAATYRLFVHAFDTDGPDVNFTLFSWVLADVDAGNMIVNGPFAATIGSTHTVNLTTTGLTAGLRYLGQVTYTGSVSGAIGTPTIVSGKAS